MPARVPTEADFAHLTSSPAVKIVLTWPKPAELTTSFLIVFHGLGDHEIPYAGFAEGVNLPGVLSIAVQGTTPLPLALLGDPDAQPGRHFHWGDDIKIDDATGEIDPDPGYEKAETIVRDRLIKETLIDKLGWSLGDIMFFGFGQGGSLALGLASKLRVGPPLEEEQEGKAPGDAAFKGVLSLGGPLPRSMVPTVSARGKAKTKVLALQFELDEIEELKAEFENVEVAHWRRKGVSMPREKEEMVPIMKFFADCLNDGMTGVGGPSV
ncbi:hypothetical protein HYQ44_013301 [Verticillium longisporum]|nr:hypothetical protein HYQ44_013301 [Verticillium longisporum]